MKAGKHFEQELDMENQTSIKHWYKVSRGLEDKLNGLPGREEEEEMSVWIS